MSDKRYTVVLYPESYKQLQKILKQGHESIWARVGWYMAFEHETFIIRMNEILGVVALPELGIDECCKKYLAALSNVPREDFGASKPLNKSILDMKDESYDPLNPPKLH